MNTEVSAIVVVSERFDGIEPLYLQYRDALASTGRAFEFVYVLDGPFPDVTSELQSLRDRGEPVRIVQLGKWYGESVALSVARERAAGDILLMLPAYAQVEASELPRLLDRLSDDKTDVVLAVRSPRRDPAWNRIPSRMMHGLLRLIAGSDFRDLGCGARAYRRAVLEEVPVYGDLHRFLPLLAERAGFSVREVEMSQAPADMGRRVYRPGIYVRRLLDLLTVFFLVKFTKKPLRFFGLLGAASAGLGAIALTWLIVDRLFFSTPLADRPALLLSVLMFAVGIQLIAVGLIGELVIFTHGLNMKEYAIDRVVEDSGEDTPAVSATTVPEAHTG